MNHPAARDYDVHGRRLRVRGATPAMASLLDAVFSAYECVEDGTPELELDLEAHDAVEPPGDLRSVGEAEDGTRFEISTPGHVVVRAQDVGQAVIAPDGRSARAGLFSAEPGWPAGHRLVEPVVVELLRSRGLYGIHAGAVSSNGQGLLLCGRSGSGKSTAALALARSGWSFLADDTCYLDGSAAPGTVRARWSDIHLTSTSLEVLLRPEEREAVHRPSGSEKYFIPVKDFPSIDPVADCHARWIVFPRIVERDASRLVPVSQAEALPELLAQSLVPGRPEAFRAHFDALVDLCAGVETFRLEAGRDLGGLITELDRLRHASGLSGQEPY